MVILSAIWNHHGDGQEEKMMDLKRGFLRKSPRGEK